jgi:hypothetical protein
MEADTACVRRIKTTNGFCEALGKSVKNGSLPRRSRRVLDSKRIKG